MIVLFVGFNDEKRMSIQKNTISQARNSYTQDLYNVQFFHCFKLLANSFDLYKSKLVMTQVGHLQDSC